VATISPFKKMRDDARNIFTAGSFIEVFIDASLATCEARDIKGLYRKARSGALKQFTGIDSDYEIPQNPELHLHTDQKTPDEGVAQIIAYLKSGGYLHSSAHE
jgi:adenylylsulfate kinase